ncbi:MAG: hypothetical protein HOQ28_03060 [Thermoleophilia bacterium]|nr:hypothetical protein [Thermoleophilia bacterium]
MIVPLHLGGDHAAAPVVVAGAVAWTEDGAAFVARAGQTRRVGAGKAIGIDGRNVVLLRGRELVDGSRSRRVNATDARWGDGHLLTTHPDPDGRVSVVVDGRTVEHVRTDQAKVYPGQINARYAVWTAGGAGHFYVERYRLGDGRIDRVPGGDYAHPQYGAAVDAGGAVYYARSGFGCGGATLYRWRHGRVTRLASLARSQDYSASWYAGGSLYFDLGDCSGRTQHLVRLPLA